MTSNRGGWRDNVVGPCVSVGRVRGGGSRTLGAHGVESLEHLVELGHSVVTALLGGTTVGLADLLVKSRADGLRILAREMRARLGGLGAHHIVEQRGRLHAIEESGGRR